MKNGNVLVAYKLKRSDCSGWLCCGTTPTEVGKALKDELDSHGGLSADECGVIEIVPYETTQAEIDGLPDFEGW